MSGEGKRNRAGEEKRGFPVLGFENDAIEAARAQRVTDIYAFAGMPFQTPFFCSAYEKFKEGKFTTRGRESGGGE